MLHRVSSRPRLISDADAASFITTARRNELDDVTSFTSSSAPNYQPLQSSDDISFVSCLERTDSALILPYHRDDDGLVDEDAANINNGSSKRKRLSSVYMTPSSSFATLPTTNLIHPLSVTDDDVKPRELTLHRHLTMISLTSLPEESIVLIASYLPSRHILRSLSSVNRTLRDVLFHSQSAIEEIWMEVLRQEFPRVFTSHHDEDGIRRRMMLTSSQVTFVDSSEIFSSSNSNRDFEPSISSNYCSKSMDHKLSNTNNVNLAMLTALIPSRHPKCIDKATLNMCGVSGRRSFKSFYINFDQNESNAFNNDEEVEAVTKNNGVISSTEYAVPILPVIQFIGRVGTGDRCIRSDQPFPSIQRINSMQKHNTLRLSKSSSTTNTSNTNSSALHPPLTPRVSHPPFVGFTPPLRLTIPALTPNHSPLLRLLSSLSHHDTTALHDNEWNNTPLEDEDDEIGTNNYSIFNFGKCKECFGKMVNHVNKLRCNSNAGSYTPFVVPIALSKEQTHDICGINSSTRISVQRKLLVDLTPRLCAYFEVSILKVPATISNDSDDTTDARHHQQHNVNAPFANQLVIQRDNIPRRSMPRLQPRRFPGRVSLPPHPLAMEFHNDVMFEPAPLRRHREPHPINFPRPRPPFPPSRNTSTLDCVAIGLSTLAFNPRNKMPGWDTNSYGYHGDDGGIFHGHGDMIRPYGPSFGVGDTVGCGLDYVSKRIFFVKNGLFLGYAFDELGEDVMERGLYPTVGVDTVCPLFVNFGDRPFGFDLNKFVKEGCQNEGVVESA